MGESLTKLCAQRSTCINIKATRFQVSATFQILGLVFCTEEAACYAAVTSSKGAKYAYCSGYVVTTRNMAYILGTYHKDYRF